MTLIPPCGNVTGSSRSRFTGASISLTGPPSIDICKVAVTPAFERSCGFATSYTLLVARSGHHLELPPAAKASAEEAADAIRAFLGLDEKT